MSENRVRLEVKERDATGTRPSKRLRRGGFVPGVLYGSGEPHPFVVPERELRRALGGDHGKHAILDVVLEGEQGVHHAVLKDYQLDPRRSSLVHVDLHEVRLDRPIQTQVMLELIGTPEGVSLGGLLSQIVREVTVEALPMAVPERLELDVTALAIGDSLRIGDIAVPDGVAILDDSDGVAASVVAPRRAEPTDEEAAEAEGEEGAETEEEGASSEESGADSAE